MAIVLFLLYSSFLLKNIVCKRYNGELFFNCLGLACCIEINNYTGFFCHFGHYEVRYTTVGIFMCGITLCLCIIQKKIRKVKANLFVNIIFFICIVIMGLLLLAVFPSKALIISPYEDNSWDGYIAGISVLVHPTLRAPSLYYLGRVILFMLLLSVTSNIMNEEICQKLFNMMLFSIKLHLLFCLFECFLANFFFSDIASQIRSFFLGAGIATYEGLLFRGSFAMLQGLTREPSALSMVIWHFNSLLVLSNTWKENKKWILLSVILGAISGAFSFFLHISLILVLYFYFSAFHKRNFMLILFKAGIFCMSLLCVYISFNGNYITSRVQQLFEAVSALSTGMFYTLGIKTSAGTRFYSAYYTIKETMINRPLLGLGIGTAVSHSGIATIISGIGCLGFYAWFRTLCSYISLNSIKNNKRIIVLLMIVLILPNLLSGTWSVLCDSYVIPILFRIKSIAKQRMSKNNDF